jgi:hypothetical protein
VTDSSEFWDNFEKCNRDQVPERRVKRWGFSCWELLKDPIGHDHFKSFLEKEYATENLLFVEAVWNMKKLSQKDVADECRDRFDEAPFGPKSYKFTTQRVA